MPQTPVNLILPGFYPDPSLCRVGEDYSFFYALEDEPMKLLAKGETRYLAAETAGGFTGVYFGLYATGNGKSCRPSACFDGFDYRVVI